VNTKRSDSSETTVRSEKRSGSVDRRVAQVQVLKRVSSRVEVGSVKELTQGGMPGLPEWAWHL